MSGGRGNLKPSAACGAALAALLAIAYAPVVFGGASWVERDALRVTLGWREFLAAELSSGRFPEWFDGVGFGAPFAANPAHEALAPLGWMLALLSRPWGFDLYNLIHLLIAGLGTAALARRVGATGVAAPLVAGASLALGGYASSMIPNQLAGAMAWTPWVAWAADRLAASFDSGSAPRLRAAIVLAVAFAFQLAAGEPASVLIAALLGALIAATRVARRDRILPVIGAAAGAGLGGAFFAAVATFPALLLLSTSARGAGFDEGGLAWSLHPARLLEWIWPMAYGSQVGDGWLAGLMWRDGAGDPYWSYSLFVGTPVLLLALGAASGREGTRLRRLLWWGLGFLLLATGPLTPVYGLLRPIALRWVNFPEKFVYGALVLCSAAAGVGFARWSRDLGADGARRLRRWALAAALLLAAAALFVTLDRDALTARLEARAGEWGVLVRVPAGLAAAVRGAWVAAGATGLFWLALRWGGRENRGRALALAATLAPLVWAAGVTTPFAPRALSAATPAVLRRLPLPPPESPRPRLLRLEPRDAGGPYRDGADVARGDHESIDTNIAARFGVDVLPGFEPSESRLSRRFGREILPRMSESAVVRLLGIDYIATQRATSLRLPLARLLGQGEEGWGLLATATARPRAFVAPRWREVRDAEAGLDALAIPGREEDPWLVTIVDPARTVGSPLPEAATAAAGSCRVEQTDPDRLSLDCETSVAGYAVLLEEARAGWSATLNGEPAQVLVADGLFRAVAVPAGAGQRIVFIYRTPGLRLGAGVSALMVLIAGWLWLGNKTSAPSRGRRVSEPANEG